MLGDKRKQKPTDGSSWMIHLRGRIQFLLLSLRNYVFLKQSRLAAAPGCVRKYEAGFDSTRTIWGLREGSVWWPQILHRKYSQFANFNLETQIVNHHLELAHSSDTTSSWSFIGWYIPNMRMESRPIVVCVKISSWVRPRLHLPVNRDYLLSIHQRLRENFQF